MTQDALEAARLELDATWRAMNSPKVTARQMSALYRRAQELRALIANLENSEHDNPR